MPKLTYLFYYLFIYLLNMKEISFSDMSVKVGWYSVHHDLAVNGHLFL